MLMFPLIVCARIIGCHLSLSLRKNFIWFIFARKALVNPSGRVEIRTFKFMKLSSFCFEINETELKLEMNSCDYEG